MIAETVAVKILRSDWSLVHRPSTKLSRAEWTNRLKGLSEVYRAPYTKATPANFALFGTAGFLGKTGVEDGIEAQQQEEPKTMGRG